MDLHSHIIDFGQLKKNSKRDAAGFKKIKLAIIADFASQFLVQAIKGYGIEHHIDYQIFEADYNQIDRQVFDPGSELYQTEADFIIILRSSERLLKDFYKLDILGKETFAQTQVEYLASLCQHVESKLQCKVITNTFTEINDAVFGNYATKTRQSFTYQVKKLNTLLMDLSQGDKSLFLADVASLAATNGYINSFDAKMYVTADMVYSIDFLPYVAHSIHSIIQAIKGAFKKCIILDLDNTTWGGIIGDDGIEGIQIGELGIGKAFTELQLWIKELKKRGIVLAVCSKNTEAIAKEPFEKHPDMVLRLDDIAVFVANWENKVDNIRYIQSVLNIGFDAMVFLDDNPFEREMVKQAIPEITVPLLPEDPAEYLLFLRGLNLFEIAAYTDEDTDRTKQYQQEAKRNTLQKSYVNEDDFLKSLNMESEVKAFDSFSIPRVAQLSQRSNQFNLRTIRYTEADLVKLSADKDYYTISFTLCDSYGDSGLISVIILKKDNDALFIDTWIMSCRVLKRGMENFVLNTIAAIATANGFAKITGEYIPTPKNEIVKNHYTALGFSKEGNLFTLLLNSYVPRTSFIKKKNGG